MIAEVDARAASPDEAQSAVGFPELRPPRNDALLLVVAVLVQIIG